MVRRKLFDGLSEGKHMELLAGKVALVTGAAKGMGKAIARLFAQQGASVVVAARKLDAAQAVADSLPGNAMAVALDVTQAGQWQAAIEAIEAKYGRLDVLVNNAGVSSAGSTEGVSEESYRWQIEVNAMGPFFGFRAVLPLMRKSGEPCSIVNIGSAFSVRLVPGFAAYGASKAALNAMAQTFALELAMAGDPIRVNTIHPGGTETEMLEEAYAETGLPREEAVAMFVKIHPNGKMGKPEQVAQAALWLASDLSNHTTGAELPVDGGSTIRP